MFAHNQWYSGVNFVSLDCREAHVGENCCPELAVFAGFHCRCQITEIRCEDRCCDSQSPDSPDYRSHLLCPSPEKRGSCWILVCSAPKLQGVEDPDLCRQIRRRRARLCRFRTLLIAGGEEERARQHWRSRIWSGVAEKLQ